VSRSIAVELDRQRKAAAGCSPRFQVWLGGRHKRIAHPPGVAHRQRDFVQHVQMSRAFDLTNQRGHRIDIEIQGPGQSVQVRLELQTLVRATLFIEGVIAGAGKNIQIFTQHFLPVELFVVLGLQALVIFRDAWLPLRPG
jgi:hypothetical protein